MKRALMSARYVNVVEPAVVGRAVVRKVGGLGKEGGRSYN
jgi:hypothetical protein